MSYCRFGVGSDLYVWTDGESWFVHSHTPRLKDFQVKSREALLERLEEAAAEGVTIPAHVFGRLRDEIADNRQYASWPDKRSLAEWIKDHEGRR